MIWPALYISAILFGAHGVNKNPDAARAQILTGEGRRLMASGDYASACSKFASSQTLDPGPSAAADLAVCYEKADKLQSAADAFVRVETAASAAGQKGRVAWAKKKLAALQPKLSRLTITVPPAARVAGLEIRCDGEPVQADHWGVPGSRDGGGHDIQAEAPGKNPWSTHVELKASGQTLVVNVPALDDAKTPSPDAQAAAPSEATPVVGIEKADEGEHRGQTQRLVGIVMGAAGIVGAGVGGAFALMAKSQMNTAQSEANPAAHNDSVSALNNGNMATVWVGAGAAVAVAGAVVWLTAPSAPVTVGTNGSALLVRGTF